VVIFCQINATQYKINKLVCECVHWLASGNQLPLASCWQAIGLPLVEFAQNLQKKHYGEFYFHTPQFLATG
jgi:hypothetical protein